MVAVLDELRISTSIPTEDESADSHWTLALAGGDGQRLRDYVQRRFGQTIPKQYCRLLGDRSMLEHTLDRLATLTPPSRTLAVIAGHHVPIALPQLRDRCDHVFVQPASRDTGMAVFVCLALIKRWSPQAVVTITPTDHYVAPAERYVQQVRSAQGVAARMRDTIVLLGARPSEPDPDLGYLDLGERLIQLPAIHKVAAFVEKPAVARAQRLCASGALWNTLVACGTVDAFWELGRATQPRLLDILDALVPLVGTDLESEAIHYIYRAYRGVNFSTDVLERAPDRLAALDLDGVEWSDWGQPERVETTIGLRRSRVTQAESCVSAASTSSDSASRRSIGPSSIGTSIADATRCATSLISSSTESSSSATCSN